MLAWKRMHLPAALTLALLVPALLAGAWAWLRFDGSLERLRSEEQREALAVIASAQQRVTAALAQAAAGPDRPGTLTVTLDAQGQPLAPFQVVSPGAAELPGEAPAWLDAALQHEAAGEPERALEFLRVGGAGLPLVAVLAQARCRARIGQTAAARSALAELRPKDPGGVEALLVALLEVRLAAEAGDRAPAQALRAKVFAGRMTVPLAAVATAGPWLVEWSGAPEDAAARLWQDVAEFVGQLARGERPLPTAPQPVVPGLLVVVPGTGLLRALDQATVRELVGESLAAAAPAGPWQLVLGEPATGEPGALLRGTAWSCRAVTRTALASQRQEQTAQVLLFAAALSFVAGNLLVLLLGRRQLQVSRLRGSFVDLVSHELRTPLTALSLRAEMLVREAVPAGKAGEYHRALYRDVRELGDLVARILDFARLEKGRMPCEPRPLSARTLLARSLRAERDHLRAARQRLRCEVPRVLPMLHADPEVLGRALRNLIENATKYAPAGSEVTLSAHSANGTFRLAVADQGPGIPAAERGRVFEPFQRGQGALGKPGSGLGLAIVAQAARVHGGRARVEDRPGGGAVFVVELPLRSGGAA